MYDACSKDSISQNNIWLYLLIDEPRHEKTGFLHMRKQRRRSASLYYLNPKFQASSHLLWLYRLVCVGPGRKPRRPVFSQRGSNRLPSGVAWLVAYWVSGSVACPLHKRAAPRSTLTSGTFFHEKKFISSTDSRGTSCKLLAKEWVLITGKLPLEGLPRNNVVK